MRAHVTDLYQSVIGYTTAVSEANGCDQICVDVIREDGHDMMVLQLLEIATVQSTQSTIPEAATDQSIVEVELSSILLFNGLL